MSERGTVSARTFYDENGDFFDPVPYVPDTSNPSPGREYGRREQVEEVLDILETDGPDAALQRLQMLASAMAIGMAGDTLRTLVIDLRGTPGGEALAAALGETPQPIQPLDNAQKKKAVTKILRRTPGISDRDVAKLAGVSHPFVASVRRELETVTTQKSGDKTCKYQTDNDKENDATEAGENSDGFAA